MMTSLKPFVIMLLSRNISYCLHRCASSEWLRKPELCFVMWYIGLHLRCCVPNQQLPLDQAGFHATAYPTHCKVYSIAGTSILKSPRPDSTKLPSATQQPSSKSPLQGSLTSRPSPRSTREPPKIPVRSISKSSKSFPRIDEEPDRSVAPLTARSRRARGSEAESILSKLSFKSTSKISETGSDRTPRERGSSFDQREPLAVSICNFVLLQNILTLDSFFNLCENIHFAKSAGVFIVDADCMTRSQSSWTAHRLEYSPLRK